ncbi:MAG: hypothetical protein H6700_08145 [Myxococcales bacterium]|nr:hypothetical protein [Myxococcales bacterium]MCB9531723.1 hypothetical protein [Myxococcales bacterium]
MIRLDVAWTWDGAPARPDECAAVVVRRAGGQLVVDIDAPFHGDPPPPAAAGELDGLWNHEVVELMLVGASGRYLELEVGPHGHSLAIALSGVRVREALLDLASVDVAISDGRWQARVTLDGRHVPPGVTAANAFAIHGIGTARRFLCAAPTRGERPDFHRLAEFVRIDDSALDA